MRLSDCLEAVIKETLLSLNGDWIYIDIAKLGFIEEDKGALFLL